MIRRPPLVAAIRAANLAFFVLTSTYGLLVYNPFTNEQFVKPHVSAVLTAFAVWHADLYWLVLSLTALTIAPYLERSRARWVGWSYLGASIVLGLWLTTHPLWLVPGTSRVALVLAIVAAVPPIWLGVFDHLAVEQQPRLVASASGATWRAALGAGTFTWAVFALEAPFRLHATGGIDLNAGGLVAGIAASAVTHLAAFTAVALLLMSAAAVASLLPRRGRDGSTGAAVAEHWLLNGVWAVVVAWTLATIVLAPISITGLPALAVSASLGAAIAVAWSGIARHRLRAVHGRAVSALDAFLAPIHVGRSWTASIVALVILPMAAYAFMARVATFDWEFLLQKLAALVFWLVAFTFVHALTARSAPRSHAARRLWTGPVAVLGAFVGLQAGLPRVAARIADLRLNPDFVLDGYAAVDPSFRIAHDWLGVATPSDAAEFYAYLRANSTIDQTKVAPVDIAFVPPGTRAPGRPPNIFLFIIDSLRRDYLSVYNPAVPFTPAISRFAADSFVFRRAFSRYGGTGLAVPSIWAGSMLLHKQYVTPFRSMNALEKLVDDNEYRRFISEDHISDELFDDQEGTVGLDHQVPEMLHTFCRTMGELERDLASAKPGGRPLFAMTRPLDLHIGNIASATVPPGESYPGFYGPYAARVRRIDACLGTFIDRLKASGLYDDSIIVLTSDHGDSLGEGQRWGHGFTVFPEVMRIPLIIHLPSSMRAEVAADLGRVTFSVDITPSLYALLGERPEVPRAHADLMGAPLFVPRSTDLAGLADRRQGAFLVASSYGAVYGLLSRNGRHLYIADGIEGREYAYDLRPDGPDRRLGITDAERDASRSAIRRQIGEIAAWYGFTPQ